MPPPNITGILHLGHAYFATLQDTAIRFRRMQGRRALWLPGTDHAGLATQEKLDAAMLARGLDPGGPEFLPFAAEWKESHRGTITGQLRRMGASCDWSRERFTLDERYSRSVTEALRRCHEAGMLHRRDGQWWLDMSEPAARLLGHMDAGDLRILPESEGKTLRHFLGSIEPWCISRQIRWGHTLPIWTLPEGGIRISDECPCPGAIRETDVLDTWFSSALWPFASLGWPDDTPDMRAFYPADLIETADDILFFWGARMLMMGLLLTERLPFRTVFLHGLVRDAQGRKMSKSLGNGIDPLDVIARHGTDPLRIALLESTTPGLDLRFREEALLAGRALCSKLWNAARFTLSHWERMGGPPVRRPAEPRGADAALIHEFDAAAREATEALEDYDFRRYAAAVRTFAWDRLCSFHIEGAKDRLRADDIDALAALAFVLDGTLRLAHPMAPYITERIRSAYTGEPLISAVWPG